MHPRDQEAQGARPGLQVEQKLHAHVWLETQSNVKRYRLFRGSLVACIQIEGDPLLNTRQSRLVNRM